MDDVQINLFCSKINLHRKKKLNKYYAKENDVCVLQISPVGADDTYLLPDLLQKISSSSPSHKAPGQQQQAQELSYSQSPTTPRSPTHQEVHVSNSKHILL